MPGIDKRDVEAADLVADLLEAFANVESIAAIVRWQAIVEPSGQRYISRLQVWSCDRSISGVAPPGRERAQFEIVTIAMHLGQMIDEVRLVPLLRQQQAPQTKP